MKNRSWLERRHHRDRMIRRRVQQYRDLDGGWTLPEQVGRLAKNHSETLAVWCDRDWSSESRGDSVRRNHIINDILDRDQQVQLQAAA